MTVIYAVWRKKTVKVRLLDDSENNNEIGDLCKEREKRKTKNYQKAILRKRKKNCVCPAVVRGESSALCVVSPRPIGRVLYNVLMTVSIWFVVTFSIREVFSSHTYKYAYGFIGDYESRTPAVCESAIPRQCLYAHKNK